MSKINVLSSKVYNRISAGEVVENPASIVKELVENAIDAGSTFITIEINDGGIKQIRITDNGCGILFEDLEKAFLPHATSKISVAEDLDCIETLGFRGEALASIASVSQIELISKAKEEDLGGKITLSGGEVLDLTQYSCKDGTIICVKNLFYNTPARLKFLKSSKREESLVTNIVNRLILANPNLAFKYVIDGKIIYNSILSGLKEKIFNVYGKTTIENLVFIQNQNEKYKVSGYISKPEFCKSNKTYQTLIVNGRYVVNSTISVAVSNAYENFLMKGKFPFFVLNLDLPLEDLDVNVHPSKMEVKFKDNNHIYTFIYSSILKVLSESNYAKALLFEENENSIFEKNIINKENTNNNLKEVKGGFSFSNLNKLTEELKNISVQMPSYNKEVTTLNSDISLEFDNNNLYKTCKYNESYDTVSSQKDKADNFDNFNNVFAKINKEDNSFVSFESKKQLREQKEFENLDLNYKVIGTLFNTYLLIESSNNFYLIDQHAGHERVLFDKLLKNFEDKKQISQPLLVPYVFEVNSIEKDLVLDNMQVFFDLGFEIELFGNNSFKINTIPLVLSGINLESFVSDALKNINKISSTNNEIKYHFAKCACRSAIKAGDQLSKEEIEFLLNQIITNKTILLCPHGRPIFIRFSQTEIEKMFKRIV